MAVAPGVPVAAVARNVRYSSPLIPSAMSSISVVAADSGE